MFKNAIILVGFIFLVVPVIIVGIPILMFSTDMDSILLARFILNGVIMMLISFMYYIKKHQKLNLITTLSYSKRFNKEKYGQLYLDYLFKMSLMLFLPVMILSVSLQLLSIQIEVDWFVFVVMLIMWIILGYQKSEALQ